MYSIVIIDIQHTMIVQCVFSINSVSFDLLASIIAHSNVHVRALNLIGNTTGHKLFVLRSTYL